MRPAYATKQTGTTDGLPLLSAVPSRANRAAASAAICSLPITITPVPDTPLPRPLYLRYHLAPVSLDELFLVATHIMHVDLTEAQVGVMLHMLLMRAQVG